LLAFRPELDPLSIALIFQGRSIGNAAQEDDGEAATVIERCSIAGKAVHRAALNVYVRHMSALGPIATKLMRRNELPLSADCVAKVAENGLWNCILKQMNRGGCAFESILRLDCRP
jgi:hypothetical protein